jgi:hypothetical protein
MINVYVSVSRKVHLHRGLNMELDLQSFFGLHVHMPLYSLADTHPLSPPLGSYTRVLLVSQDRRHLFVTP